MTEGKDKATQSTVPTNSEAGEEWLEDGPEKRYHDLLALSRISAAVSASWDLDTILEVALDNVLSIINGAAGGIWLLDEETQTLYYRVHRGVSAETAKKIRLRLGEGIVGRVAQTGKSVLLEDISADPHVASPELVRKEKLRAFVSVPLRSKEAVLGVINVVSHTPRRFTKNDEHLLQSIGDQVGVAIEHARASREIAKLEEEKRRFLRFVGVAAHDLKAPLTAIQGFLWVMLDGFAGPLTDKQRDMIERSSVRIKELLGLISDLLDIPRIETGQLVDEMKEVSLSEVIECCCQDLRDVAAGKGLKLEIELPEPLPEVYGSASRLQQVVTNLLSNAITYTPDGVVTVRVKEGEKDIQIEVLDTGIGVPPEDLPRLFEDFFRASNVDTKGTGLGLSISKRIVEAHGGRIWVESPCPETNSGSRFAFTLPKRSEGLGRQRP